MHLSCDKPKDMRKETVKAIQKMSNKPVRKPSPPKTRKFFELKRKK
jgi:hypothetical protein